MVTITQTDSNDNDNEGLLRSKVLRRTQMLLSFNFLYLKDKMDGRVKSYGWVLVVSITAVVVAVYTVTLHGYRT
jgi:heme/copper-type cytochrome/quinol oxidase subunit 4